MILIIVTILLGLGAIIYRNREYKDVQVGGVFMIACIISLLCSVAHYSGKYERYTYSQEPKILHTIEVTYKNGDRETLETIDPDCSLFSSGALGNGPPCLWCRNNYRGKNAPEIYIFDVRGFKYVGKKVIAIK